MGLAALLVACGGPLEPEDGSVDGRDGAALEDAGLPQGDEGAPVEAGAEADARFEDPPDMVEDASVDGAVDASSDARADALHDGAVDASPDAARDGGVVDGGPGDAGTPPVDADAGIAPPNAIAGETLVREGATSIRLAAGEERVVRVDARAGEHIAFRLEFTPVRASAVLRLHRWSGTAVTVLGETDAGSGIRVLAALDPTSARTVWARVVARAALTGTLTVTRTPFTEGSRCASDCARLLQLPLRNDPRVDGYDHASSTVFRYQFGRRDLLMFLRHAGREMARAGRAPFVPEDLSQWNGETPGTDVGSPRHASHQRGKDVDLSLYGLDGLAPWRSYCRAERTSDGRECVAGTRTNYDAETNALYFLRYFESNRVTMCFLDRELIAPTVTAANALAARGALPTDLARLYGDGRHLQHWPNHDNHIHVRVSEAAQAAQIVGGEPETSIEFEPFEPP